MATLSILCQLSGGCMGCCGHDFISKEKILEAIKFNTKEFKFVNLEKESSLINFRDRARPSNLRHGVCRNLINKDGKLLCPLHPSLNKGKELREGHCDVNYLCKTAKEFQYWYEEKQQRFLNFINDKNLDNVSYSIKMDKGTLLKEFEEKEKMED